MFCLNKKKRNIRCRQALAAVSILGQHAQASSDNLLERDMKTWYLALLIFIFGGLHV